MGWTPRFPRAPDFIIGGAEHPYIYRWWLIPRNTIFNIYLHKIVRDDDDRALHDHPWVNCSIIIKGRYVEVTPKGRFLRKSWIPIFRRPTAAHRLELVDGHCWSLFITGPRIREWGFYCSKGWVHWKIFTDPADSARVGRGCE
jgi:hypothetical protein